MPHELHLFVRRYGSYNVYDHLNDFVYNLHSVTFSSFGVMLILDILEARRSFAVYVGRGGRERVPLPSSSCILSEREGGREELHMASYIINKTQTHVHVFFIFSMLKLEHRY